MSLKSSLLACEHAEVLLATEEEMTVFAPTNEAMDSLLEGRPFTLPELSESPELFSLIQSHIAASAVDNTVSYKGAMLRSLGGDILSIVPTQRSGLRGGYAIAGAGLQEESASILGEQIVAGKVNIFVIDQVLLPSTADMSGSVWHPEAYHES